MSSHSPPTLIDLIIFRHLIAAIITDFTNDQCWFCRLNKCRTLVMSVFFLTALSSLSVSAPPQQHTQTHIISLILPLLSILTLWCSGLSCKVLQISIRRRAGIIHMFMRTGVCQSQGQVAHPRECVHVCVCVCEWERFNTPSSLSLSVSLSTPWQHFLGERTQYKVFEHFHKHTRTHARTHLSKAVVDHEPWI